MAEQFSLPNSGPRMAVLASSSPTVVFKKSSSRRTTVATNAADAATSIAAAVAAVTVTVVISTWVVCARVALGVLVGTKLEILLLVSAPRVRLLGVFLLLLLLLFLLLLLLLLQPLFYPARRGGCGSASSCYCSFFKRCDCWRAAGVFLDQLVERRWCRGQGQQRRATLAWCGRAAEYGVVVVAVAVVVWFRCWGAAGVASRGWGSRGWGEDGCSRVERSADAGGSGRGWKRGCGTREGCRGVRWRIQICFKRAIGVAAAAAAACSGAAVDQRGRGHPAVAPSRHHLCRSSHCFGRHNVKGRQFSRLHVN